MLLHRTEPHRRGEQSALDSSYTRNSGSSLNRQGNEA
jgi:hypothetical protein